MFRAILGLQRVMSIALRQADAVVKWVALLVFKRFRFVSFISLAMVTPLVSVLWDLHKILWLLKSSVMTNGFGGWPKIRVSGITLVAITSRLDVIAISRLWMVSLMVSYMSIPSLTWSGTIFGESIVVFVFVRA